MWKLKLRIAHEICPVRRSGVAAGGGSRFRIARHPQRRAFRGLGAATEPRCGSSWGGWRPPVQVHSRTYFVEEMQTQGFGVKADVLQATVNYSRFGDRGSVVVRAGVLNSAFGSFLLR
jgi:hypothetical protein